MAVVESLEALDHVVVLFAHLHDTQLVLDDLTLLGVFGFDELKGAHLAVLLALNKENSCETTIPNFLHDFIVFGRIFLTELSSILEL